MKKIFFLILFIQSISLSFGASTNLGVYYQFQEYVNKIDSHRWDVDDPDHYLELKLFSDKIKNTSTFIKIGVGGSNPDNNAWFSEANLKYRITTKNQKKGMEFNYYYNQDRLWMPDHIIQIVGDWQRYNIEGLRTDFWLPHNITGTFCFGSYNEDKWTNNKAGTDDFYFYTLRHYINKLKLKYNVTFAEKRWGDNSDEHNWLFGLFTQFQLKNNIYFSNEILRSSDPSQTDSNKNIGFKSELQWLKLSSIRLGEIGYKFMYWNFGKNYRNYLANENYEKIGDERGIHNEVYYNFPEKAITLVLKDIYKQDGDGNKKDNEIYTELYIEFIQGFKFKTYYKFFKNANGQSYPEAFFQIERDLKNIWYKFQYKIKDIGTTYKKNIAGLETSLKLSKKFTLTNRFLVLSQPELDVKRESFYSQLKYDLGSNAEMFLEYGSGWHGNDDLTNDGDFVDNNNAKTEHKFFYKFSVWF